VQTHPQEVKRHVGYLPEGAPLYVDMRVGEYLGFRAALRAIPRRGRAAAVDRAIERCGLGDRRRQIIGTLSRGYRQRVGMADAVLAEPPILILDEPTVGLDPNQIVEMRALVRDLGRERAVLLSTHILPDVEALAARVVILHQGRVLAADSPAALRARLGGHARVRVAVRPADGDAAAAALRALAAVTAVERVDGPGGPDAVLAVLVNADGGAAREAISAALGAAGVGLRELRAEELPLEEVFARITAGPASPAEDQRPA